MTTALHAAARVRTDGKFLCLAGSRFLVKGTTYGTFVPSPRGDQFPEARRIEQDFTLMAAHGLNTVRTYTVPSRTLLDQAAAHGLHVMVGLPWMQHVAFLDDRALTRQIRHDLVAAVRHLAGHPAALMFAIGNEIPASIVRWHGVERIEHFLAEICDELRNVAPDALLTYVNYPPTEYLDLPFLDVCAFNVYLHDETAQRSYLARLQHLAGSRPLLLAEAGADSLHHGEDGQARLTAMQVRAAFAEGACGAVAFAWTDDWWRGGFQVEDWTFGLVDADRRPKPALAAVADAFVEAPFPEAERRTWPRVSAVVCACNAADTIDDCLSSLARLTYPDFEIIVVNDGSRDGTGEWARLHPRVTVIDVPNGGLSTARNIGLSYASAEIVAYTDADARVDPDWLTYLVQPFLTSDVGGAGGPNVVPPDDPFVAQCVARSPGGPTHVLLDDRIAEHVPGCNMAFRREALLAIGGFNPIYLRAGDDVDVCWRMQARGWRLGFAASALVWHHHRSSVRAYWRQQVGYGEGELWLIPHHPDKFVGGQARWMGRIYSPLPFIRSLTGLTMDTGTWGTAGFPSVYHPARHSLSVLPHTAVWMLAALLACVVGAIFFAAGLNTTGLAALAAGMVGLGITLTRSAGCALQSDLRGCPLPAAAPPALGRLAARALITWLHIVQPLARWRGRLRGRLSPASTAKSLSSATSNVPPVTARDVWRFARLAGGLPETHRFWSESWGGSDQVLTTLLRELRRRRSTSAVDVDDGWQQTRDLSVAVGPWAWLDVRALAEDHGSGRRLLRLVLRLRPTVFGIATTAAAATCVVALSLLIGRVGATTSSLLGAGLLVSLVGHIMARGTLMLSRTTSALRDACAAQAFSSVAPAGPIRLRPVSPKS